MNSWDYDNAANTLEEKKAQLQTSVASVIEKFSGINSKVAIISAGLAESEDSILNSAMAGQNQKITEAIGKTIEQINTELTTANTSIDGRITTLRQQADDARRREAAAAQQASSSDDVVDADALINGADGGSSGGGIIDV